MQIEPIDFPSDPNNVFGDLSKDLSNALHRAADHPDHHKLLTSILKFATGKLKDAKADYIAVQKHYAKREEERQAAELEAEEKKHRARYGVVVDTIEELTEEKVVLEDVLGEGDDDDDDGNGSSDPDNQE